MDSAQVPKLDLGWAKIVKKAVPITAMEEQEVVEAAGAVCKKYLNKNCHAILEIHWES